MPPELARRARGALLAVGALAQSLATRAAAAQPTPDTAAIRERGPDPLCWRGRPLPRCRNFLLLELSALTPVVSTSVVNRFPGRLPERERAFGWQLAADVGAMTNVASDRALGGSVFLGSDNDGNGPMLGARARWREWTGPRSSLDLAAGPVLAWVPLPQDFTQVGPGQAYGRGTVRRVGLVADGRLNFADLVALQARVIAVPDGRGRVHRAALVGASTGSTASVVAGALGAAFVGLVLYSLGAT